jgi:hypothetical protein
MKPIGRRSETALRYWRTKWRRGAVCRAWQQHLQCPDVNWWGHSGKEGQLRALPHGRRDVRRPKTGQYRSAWNAINLPGVSILWYSALKHTAECQPPLSNELWKANFLVNLPAECHRLGSSALKLSAECHKPRGRFKPMALRRFIWVRNVALDGNPLHAILHRGSPCLKCHIFLPCDF